MAVKRPATDQARWDELRTRPTIAIPISSTSTDLGLVSGSGILVGFMLSNSQPATAATLRFLDGTTTGGELLGSVTIPAANNASEAPTQDGPMFQRGVFLDMVAGTVEGAVWVKI